MGSYIIGGIELIWKEDNFPFQEDGMMLPFRRGENDTQCADSIVYETVFAEIDEYEQAPCLYYQDTSELRETKDGTFLIYHWGTCRFGYGFFMRELLEQDHIRCYMHPEMLRQNPMTLSRFLSTAGLHSRLLQRGGVILHSAFIARDGEAVLFAGASGVGKSTQAALWEAAGKGRTVNGDRTLLMRRAGRWYAYGYPCCGSSLICENETLPLKAIVLLQQGDQNRLLFPSYSQKIRALMAGIEIFPWEQRETEQSFALASTLADQVSMITLSARPDQQAVLLLNQYLEEL